MIAACPCGTPTPDGKAVSLFATKSLNNSCRLLGGEDFWGFSVIVPLALLWEGEARSTLLTRTTVWPPPPKAFNATFLLVATSWAFPQTEARESVRGKNVFMNTKSDYPMNRHNYEHQ